VRLNNDHADVVVNWSGGMHHAKKSEASGFCYTNDIVLACLELLKQHERVLYIDIDIHHGDGVEEAFYLSNRVMTVSFHQSKDFFPGTGKTEDTGHADGNGYSINFPLEAGMDDESFLTIFRPIIDQVAQSFSPKVVVMCCGADSIAGDRLGCWNLSIKGHAECIKYVQAKGLPLLVLGGGGYSLRNVARCWTYETAVVLGQDLKDALPFHRYYDYYGPEYRLHTPVSNMQVRTFGVAGSLSSPCPAHTSPITILHHHHHHHHLPPERQHKGVPGEDDGAAPRYPARHRGRAGRRHQQRAAWHVHCTG